jgi:hypothetical protein
MLIHHQNIQTHINTSPSLLLLIDDLPSRKTHIHFHHFHYCKFGTNSDMLAMIRVVYISSYLSKLPLLLQNTHFSKGIPNNLLYLFFYIQRYRSGNLFYPHHHKFGKNSGTLYIIRIYSLLP